MDKEIHSDYRDFRRLYLPIFLEKRELPADFREKYDDLDTSLSCSETFQKRFPTERIRHQLVSDLQSILYTHDLLALHKRLQKIIFPELMEESLFYASHSIRRSSYLMDLYTFPEILLHSTSDIKKIEKFVEGMALQMQKKKKKRKARRSLLSGLLAEILDPEQNKNNPSDR